MLTFRGFFPILNYNSLEIYNIWFFREDIIDRGYHVKYLLLIKNICRSFFSTVRKICVSVTLEVTMICVHRPISLGRTNCMLFSRPACSHSRKENRKLTKSCWKPKGLNYIRKFIKVITIITDIFPNTYIKWCNNKILSVHYLCFCIFYDSC